MINNLLKKYMESRPDDTFIHYNNNDITYENMVYALEGRIKSLQALNIKEGALVGLYLDKSLDLIEVLFACIEIKVTPLIIPHQSTKDEIKKLCNLVKFDYFITSWNKTDNLKNNNVPTFPIQELSPSIGGCAPSIQNELNDTQIACLLLTSGTTGVPKIVPLSIKNILESCKAWHERISYKTHDIYLNCLPLHHIGGLSIIFRSLLYGFKVVLVDKFKNDDCIEQIIKHRISLISLVPTMLARIIQSKKIRILHQHLRAVILGGAYCKSTLIKEAIKHNINLYKSYGMTESCSGISGFWVNNHLEYIESSGTAHNGVEFKIENDQILIKGSTVIKEYYNQSPILGWYNTNDVGHVNKDGFLYVLGRRNQIITGGENIDSSEIEDIITEHPNVNKVFINSIDDDEWGQKIIAYIDSNNLDKKTLKKWLNTKLTNHKIPKEFIFIKH